MTRNDLDFGFSETSLLATSRMDATVVTTADNNNPPCSVNRRQVNGVLKNSGGAGKGYAEVTCEDDSAECQKNATVSSKTIRFMTKFYLGNFSSQICFLYNPSQSRY